MSLPILVKPQFTTGDPSSHAIDILLSESSLPSSYSMDMVVQSYKDHNGVIYKGVRGGGPHLPREALLSPQHLWLRCARLIER